MRDDRTLLPTTGPTLGGRVDEPAFWKGTANPTPGQTHRGASHEPPPNHSDRGPSRRHDRAAHSATQGRHVVTPGTDDVVTPGTDGHRCGCGYRSVPPITQARPLSGFPAASLTLRAVPSHSCRVLGSSRFSAWRRGRMICRNLLQQNNLLAGPEPDSETPSQSHLVCWRPDERTSPSEPNALL
jgi:hypothetical protein